MAISVLEKLENDEQLITSMYHQIYNENVRKFNQGDTIGIIICKKDIYKFFGNI